MQVPLLCTAAAYCWVIVNMDWQNLLAVVLGLTALIYVIIHFIKQVKKPEVDPKCDDCPVPDLMDKKDKSD